LLRRAFLLACDAEPWRNLATFELRPGAPLRHGGVSVVHRGDFCALPVTLRGVLFSVDTWCDHRTIIAVSTDDQRFRTAEGLRIGDSYARALELGGKPLSDPGEPESVRMPSGWIARFAAKRSASRSFEAYGDPAWLHEPPPD